MLFTLISQAVIGAFLTLFLGAAARTSSVLSPQSHPVAHGRRCCSACSRSRPSRSCISTAHLGKPHRFYRAFNNLRWSPVSREVAGIAVFFNALGAYTLLAALVAGGPELFSWLLPQHSMHTLQNCAGWLAAVVRAGGPVCDVPHLPHQGAPVLGSLAGATSFYGSMLTLGPLVVALVYAGVLAYQGQAFSGLLAVLAMSDSARARDGRAGA